MKTRDISCVARCLTAFPATALVFLLCALATTPTQGQYPDTYVLQRGVLRISFEPSYLNWGLRFDTAGMAEPLGTDFTFDSAGAGFFPTLTPAQQAIWSITGDSTLSINPGGIRTTLDADVRRYPFNFQLGFFDRLTITASIPLVTTRAQVSFIVDSTQADVGWNQVAATSGNAASALTAVSALIGQLEASASALDGIIAGGGLDCPSGPSCAGARDLVSRARRLVSDVIALTGIDATGNYLEVVPPFAPLSTSATGQRLVDAIQNISNEFTSSAYQGLGLPSITGTIPLPTDPVGPADLQTVLTETTAGFGYDAQAFEFAKYREKLGDLELGVRVGVLQRDWLRAVVSTTVRLPTGMRDYPDHYVDIGTGDRQTDIETGLEAAFDPGQVISLAVAARYNMQMGDRLLRRLATPHQPIALAAAESMVSRNLGDELTLAAYPALRLSSGLRAYGAIQYYRKGLDSYSGPTIELPGSLSVSPTDLETETAMRRLSLGAGLHYRSTGRGGTSLPAEAGLFYHAAYHGSGGLTPKTAGVTFYLRIFKRLFGGEEVPEPTTTENAPGREVPIP